MTDKLENSSPAASIIFDASQFPENVRRDLLNSLRTREINHKFHYQSYQQASKWIALHQAHSPAWTNDTIPRMYEGIIRKVSLLLPMTPVEFTEPEHLIAVIGLGCGGGWKDSRLMALLSQHHGNLHYIPVDVGAPMVLTARTTMSQHIPFENCFPVVADLATSIDLGRILDTLLPPDASRIFTFFGMLPNFEPDVILPRLATLVGSGDFLAISANLAPGDDYAAGVDRILPQYDNQETREWLLTLFSDLGFEPRGGDLQFSVQQAGTARTLLRIEANYILNVEQKITVEGKSFTFLPGDKIRAFYSYRHTVPLVHQLMESHGLRVIDEMQDSSGQEGLFVLERRS
jgi:L-histidine N-alpha-methyltransferase